MSKMGAKAIEELNRFRSKPATMKEVNANHDAWWSSLTAEEKQKIVDEQADIENYIRNNG